MAFRAAEAGLDRRSTARSSPSSRAATSTRSATGRSSRRRSPAIGRRDPRRRSPAGEPRARPRAARPAGPRGPGSRPAPRRPADRRAASRRFSWRIQPARIAASAGEEQDVAGDPHEPAGDLLVLERRSGPTSGRASRSGRRGRRVEFRIVTARNVFWGIWRNTYIARTGWGIRHGLGSRPTAGHQNRSPAPRYSACSRSWIERVLERRRRTAARSAVPHITPANTSQDTTGKLRTRMTREWRIGRITRLPDVRRRRPAGAS